MANLRKVLITGVTGLIGDVIYRDLREDYEITGLARRPFEGVKHFQADIRSLQDILPAFVGQDAVIHLAADPSKYAPWDSILPNNIIGTRNVFEACVECGVRKVIFASSNHVTGMYERDHPYHHIVKGEYDKVDVWLIPMISHESDVRPDGYYGVSKAFGEALGRYHSEENGISVICLRIGSVRSYDSPTKNIRHFATWLSQRDLKQLVRRSMEHYNIGFDIFYGVSNNKWRFWDIDHARDVIGYEPQDDAEDYRGLEEF